MKALNLQVIGVSAPMALKASCVRDPSTIVPATHARTVPSVLQDLKDMSVSVSQDLKELTVKQVRLDSVHSSLKAIRNLICLALNMNTYQNELLMALKVPCVRDPLIFTLVTHAKQCPVC